MLTDPEEGHYSAEYKAEKAFRPALFTPDCGRCYSCLLRTDTQRRLFKVMHRQGQGSQRQPEIRLQTWGTVHLYWLWWRWILGKKTSSCLCAGVSPGDVTSQFYEVQQRSSWEFIHWRQQHLLGAHALKIYQNNRDTAGLGHCTEEVSTLPTHAGWLMCCTL